METLEKEQGQGAEI